MTKDSLVLNAVLRGCLRLLGLAISLFLYQRLLQIQGERRVGEMSFWFDKTDDICAI